MHIYRGFKYEPCDDGRLDEDDPSSYFHHFIPADMSSVGRRATLRGPSRRELTAAEFAEGIDAYINYHRLVFVNKKI